MTAMNATDYQREGGPLDGGSYTTGSAPMTYARALEIARGPHPSRVLANTNGYRYGRFTEGRYGSVFVTMMGSHIATFTLEGVQLWSRGYVTVSTTEALSNLVTGGWFGTQNGVIMFRPYASPPPGPWGEPFAEGTVYPYPATS